MKLEQKGIKLMDSFAVKISCNKPNILTINQDLLINSKYHMLPMFYLNDIIKPRDALLVLGELKF